MYEFNPMGGGRIIRDKLWFYMSYRQIATDNTVPGMWVNRNAGNPNAWTVDFDRSQQAYSRNLDRIVTGARHVAGDAAQQDQRQLAGADLSAQLERRRHRDDDDRSDQPRLVRAVAPAGRRPGRRR